MHLYAVVCAISVCSGLPADDQASFIVRLFRSSEMALLEGDLPLLLAGAPCATHVPAVFQSLQFPAC
eukprot:5890936-Alexandrium_andersonii.AAC.1